MAEKLKGFPDFLGRGTAVPFEPVDVFVVAGATDAQRKQTIKERRNGRRKNKSV
jgi:hypothetical protein